MDGHWDYLLWTVKDLAALLTAVLIIKFRV
jgi:hypothetical protein